MQARENENPIATTKKTMLDCIETIKPITQTLPNEWGTELYQLLDDTRRYLNSTTHDSVETLEKIHTQHVQRLKTSLNDNLPRSWPEKIGILLFDFFKYSITYLIVKPLYLFVYKPLDIISSLFSLNRAIIKAALQYESPAETLMTRYDLAIKKYEYRRDWLGHHAPAQTAKANLAPTNLLSEPAAENPREQERYQNSIFSQPTPSQQHERSISQALAFQHCDIYRNDEKHHTVIRLEQAVTSPEKQAEILQQLNALFLQHHLKHTQPSFFYDGQSIRIESTQTEMIKALIHEMATPFKLASRL